MSFEGCIFPEGPVTVELIRIDTNLSTKGIKTIAFLYLDKIYTSNTNGNNVTKITTDSVYVKNLALGYRGGQIAYRTTDNAIVIIDTTGTQIANQPSYTNIRSFGWSKDDSTLYMYDGTDILFHGPDLDLPVFEFDTSLTNIVMNKIGISRNRDLAYSYEAVSPTLGTINYLTINYYDSTKSIITYYNLSNSGISIEDLRWSGKGNVLMFSISNIKYFWDLKYQTPDELGTLKSSTYFAPSFDGMEILYSENTAGFIGLAYNLYVQSLETSSNSRFITNYGDKSTAELITDWK
ncbi:MAG: hypothetical protein COC01_00270 [Bacteroidetes bacterium]|nr:MAG: hypothetical protein COC01_00270 [Bacteroidota bacterium]